MKPFDLAAALAGEPVVTRDGRPVKIAGCNSDGITVSNHQILGWVGYGSTSWNIDGKCWQRPECDLFMAEKPKVKKEGWVNIYKNNSGGYFLGSLQFNHHGLKNAENVQPKPIAIAKIEWEEEAPETSLEANGYSFETGV